MMIMTVKSDLFTLKSSVVSHLGCPVRESLVLKVVSSVAIAGKDHKPGIQ